MRCKLLVTGAAGSVGRAMIDRLLRTRPQTDIVAVDRSEAAIWPLMELQHEYAQLSTILGDVCDYNMMDDLLGGCDAVIHCAAYKRVDSGTLFPVTVACENVRVYCTLLQLCSRNRVRKVLLCSTDKAATPSSVMAASKLLLERVSAASSSDAQRVAAVRFANIINSSGSLVPRLVECARTNTEFVVRDSRMTRYMMSAGEAIDLILYALDNMEGGETFLPYPRSACIMDVIRCVGEIISGAGFDGELPFPISIGKNIYNENIDESFISSQEAGYVGHHGDYYCLKSSAPDRISHAERRRLLGSSFGLMSYDALRDYLIMTGALDNRHSFDPREGRGDGDEGACRVITGGSTAGIQETGT